MDPLNSQTLTHFDGYYHRFTKQGDYRWGIQIKQSYLIHVQPTPGGQQPGQTVIPITFQNGDFQVTDSGKEITIYVNDHVLWHNDTPDAGIPVFSIVGDNGEPKTDPLYDFFTNRALGPEDAYSHLFLQPGLYQYSVTGGSGGPQHGSIPVSVPPNPAPPADGVHVSLADGHAPSPDPVTKRGGVAVYIGDTVLWDVVSGSNLVIKSA